VISGRTRFYVVAGVVGAIVGEVVAGVLLLGLARFFGLAVPRYPFLAIPMLVWASLVLGLLGGAWAGAEAMRWWYRREGRNATAARWP
jgi:hypothetical protein